jgi:hypothetical protein
VSLHQGAHALVLDHTRFAHLWAKDLPTVTHRGNVAGIHDALVGLGSELERRIALDGDLYGAPRLMVVIDRADTLQHLARYWETFRQEDDLKRSPAIAALEAVLHEGRAARIHVIYDGPATIGGRLIPGVREQFSTVILARVSAGTWQWLAPIVDPARRAARSRAVSMSSRTVTPTSLRCRW